MQTNQNIVPNRHKLTRTSKVIALSMGQGLTTLVGLLSAVVLSRVLDKVEYATFRQTFLAYQFAAPLMGLGIAQALYYFLPGETARIRGRVMDAFCITIFMGAIFSLFILLGGNNLLSKRFSNPQLSSSLRFLIPYPLFMLPMSLLGPILVVRERVKILSIFNVLSRLAIGLAVILPCLFWKESSVSIVGQVGMTVLTATIAVYLMFSSTPNGSWRPQWESMKEMVTYAVPLGLASMIGTISIQLNKVIVSAMCSPEEFAVYANGAMEIPLIGIITGSISAVVLADMRKMIVAGKDYEALGLFRKAAEKSAWILLPAMLFFFISADSFIKFLFSDKYAASVLPFRIYLLILPVRIVFYGPMLMAIGKSREILYRSLIGLVLNILFSILFVNIIGYLGAILATILVTYLWSVPFNFYQIIKYFHAKTINIMPFKNIAWILLLILLPSVSIYLINTFGPFDRAEWKLLVNTVLFWGFILYLWNGRIYTIGMITNRMKSFVKL